MSEPVGNTEVSASAIPAILERQARVMDRVRPWATFRIVQDIRFGLEQDQPEVVRAALDGLARASG